MKIAEMLGQKEVIDFHCSLLPSSLKIFKRATRKPAAVAVQWEDDDNKRKRGEGRGRGPSHLSIPRLILFLQFILSTD